MPRNLMFVATLFVLATWPTGGHSEDAPVDEPVVKPLPAGGHQPAGTAGPGKEEQPSAGAKRKLVSVSIKGALPEYCPVPSFLLGGPVPTDLLTLLKVFSRVQKDDSVEGVLLRLEPLACGWGKCEELRAMIRGLRAAGKKVIVWLPFGTNREYFIASAADEILMPPAGLLLVAGLRVEVTFFYGLLEKIGVEAELLHVGQFKGAGEPFTRKEMSPELRASLDAILDATTKAYLQGAAAGRRMDPDEFRKLLDRGPFTAPDAERERLIDKTVYLDVYLDEAQQQRKLKVVTHANYMGYEMAPGDPGVLLDLLKGLLMPAEPIESGRPKVALIYAVGPILSSSGPEPLMGYQEIVTAAPLQKAFQEARKNPNVKTVVLRVDSPGGDILTSDLIWWEVEKTNRIKPVVVSMSDVAASGGYYISMSSRAIVAHPTTLTGSIGVIGGKFNVQKLYDLLGMNVEVIERGSGSGLFSLHRKMSDEERQRLLHILKDAYDSFVQKAANGRKKDPAEMAKVAEGRAWAAQDAVRMGLVDELGGLEHAISVAKRQAGLKPEEKLELLVLPRPKSILEILSGMGMESRVGAWIPGVSGRLAPDMLAQLRVALDLGERAVGSYLPWHLWIR